MKKYIIQLFVFLLTLTLSAQENSKNVEQFVNRIDQKIPQILEDFSIPGAALAIIIDGEIVLQKGYGFADIEKRVKIDVQTGFNIGSISKTVAAWGIMKLVHEGNLDLDAPVQQYIKRWHFPESQFDSNKVTLRRLLSHTAGLSLPSVSAERSFDNLPNIIEWLNGKNDGIGELEIILEPGTKWEYSGGGYGLLQLIIEEVSGQKFEDYMQEEILNPLGMLKSTFKINKKAKSNSAKPYNRFGEPVEYGIYTVQAAAGFHTTLNDFIRFAFASLPNHEDHKEYNSILPTELIREMIEPAPNSAIGNWKYGLGYQSVHMVNSTAFIGHAGTNIGWEANFRIDPITQTGFIVMTNGSAGGNISNPMFCELINWESKNTDNNDCWPKLSVANKLVEISNQKGFENISDYYEILKKEQPNKYNFSENQLNELGYYYFERKEFDKAITIFKLNIDAYPYSSNAYDSYGEALLTNGNKKKAVKNYKHSIRLNPENENGIRILKSLSESIVDIHFKVPIEHLNLLGGEYKSTSGNNKVIQYEVINGELFRTYKDRDLTIKLIPIATNEFVYLGRTLHVIFDTSDINAIVLKTPGEGEFKKIK